MYKNSPKYIHEDNVKSGNLSAASTLFHPNNKEQGAPHSAITFEFNFTDANLCHPDLHQRLQSIFKSKAWADPQRSFNADQLNEEFISLNNLKDLNDSQKLAIEEYKIALLQMIKNHLPLKQQNTETPSATELSLWQKLSQWLTSDSVNSLLKWSAYLGLMIANGIWMLLTGLLKVTGSVSGLFSLLPFAVPGLIPAIIGIACIASFLIGTLCLISPLIMEIPGISLSTKSDPLLQNYKEQLTLTDEVSDLLSKDNRSVQDQDLPTIVNMLNKNIEKLKCSDLAPKENSWVKGIRILMNALAFIQSLAVSSYLATLTAGWFIGYPAIGGALLAVIHPVLLSILVPAFFIGAFHLTRRLQIDYTMDVLHPAKKEHTALKTGLEAFKGIKLVMPQPTHPKNSSENKKDSEEPKDAYESKGNNSNMNEEASASEEAIQQPPLKEKETTLNSHAHKTANLETIHLKPDDEKVATSQPPTKEKIRAWGEKDNKQDETYPSFWQPARSTNYKEQASKALKSLGERRHSIC